MAQTFAPSINAALTGALLAWWIAAAAASRDGTVVRRRQQMSPSAAMGSSSSSMKLSSHAVPLGPKLAQADIQHSFVPALQVPAGAPLGPGADFVNVTQDLGPNNPSAQFDGARPSASRPPAARVLAPAGACRCR